MKNFLLIAVGLALLYFIYQHYFNQPPAFSGPPTNAVPVQIQSNNYAKRIAPIFDSIYSRLDASIPNTKAELQTILGTCQQQLNVGGSAAELARTCRELCTKLLEANEMRENVGGQYKMHANFPFSNINGGRSAEDTRKFFLGCDLRQWENFVSSDRKHASILLQRVAELELALADHPERRPSVPPAIDPPSSPSPPADQPSVPLLDPQQVKLLDRLSLIIFPEVKFREANFSDILTYLGEQSRHLDPQGEGVNFVLQATKSKSVSILLRNTPLIEILDLIAPVGGIKYRVTANAIIVEDLDSTNSPERSGLVFQQGANQSQTAYEEGMLKSGFINYGGKWMTPQQALVEIKDAQRTTLPLPTGFRTVH